MHAKRLVLRKDAWDAVEAIWDIFKGEEHAYSCERERAVNPTDMC